MNMKPYLGYLSAGMLTLAAVSCDNVKESDRLIDYPLPEASKTVLIQEFTGQRCSNCPDGAQVIHGLQETYPDNIIAVCLHPDGPEYTRPLGPNLGLISETATEYYQYFRPTAFPFALFDGEPTPESNNYQAWSTNAIALLSEAAPANIEVEATYDADRKVEVIANVDFVGDYAGPLNISFWMMENGIVGMQTTSTGREPQYVHNHVLRTSLNGTWGSSLGSGFTLMQQIESGAKLDNPDAGWKLENCQMVVFLSDPSSHKVLQAALADLTPKSE